MEEKPTLHQVFAAEESPLLRFAYGLTGQRETAEDLVQDAFLHLHTHWHEVENPRAWLFRCTRNLALNHLRNNKRNTSLETTPHTGEEWETKFPDPEAALGRLADGLFGEAPITTLRETDGACREANLMIEHAHDVAGSELERSYRTSDRRSSGGPPDGR